MIRKILSIDGGGLKGVFPASFLSTIEATLNVRTADYFDLIVGTSTGGILALGLGAGLSAQEVLAFYESHGPTIFRGNRFVRTLRRIGVAKYSNADLRKALTEVFKDRILDESSKRLVIPSVNLETGKVHIFKTAHHPRLQIDYREKMVDVALATASAPTYFPTHTLASGVPLVDGGLWANNPVGIAVVEAISMLGWGQAELRILSLGCTTEPIQTTFALRMAVGGWYWSKKIVDVFMAAQSSGSVGIAQHLAGHENVVRISPHVSSNRFALDRPDQISALRGLGASEARESLPRVRYFFDETAELFTPIHP